MFLLHIFAWISISHLLTLASMDQIVSHISQFYATVWIQTFIFWLTKWFKKATHRLWGWLKKGKSLYFGAVSCYNTGLKLNKALLFFIRCVTQCYIIHVTCYECYYSLTILDYQDWVEIINEIQNNHWNSISVYFSVILL